MKNKHTYFFVRGFMRSGTNWVGNLLNLHPQVCVTGEYHLHKLYEGFDRISNPKRDPYGILMGSDLRLPATREFERFIRRLIDLGSKKMNKPKALFLGARTPSPLGRLILRNAKRIHIVRDGRDCLISQAFHFLRLNSGDYPFENHPRMLEKRQKFQNDPDLIRNNPDLLLDDEEWVRSRIRRWAHRQRIDFEFLKRRKEQVFSTTYEDLHANTEAIRDKMYEFLGADPSLAQRLDDQTTAGFESENVLSHYRKGKVGDWEKYFTPAVRRWFDEEAGDAMAMIGYEKNNQWVTA